ncbi:hypothetical protein [Paraburkholderia lycopersici]|uniref:Uncharacterized protein n=1 Tax=Paraburkholderia lycopersici TaxID=416944 RepID=A0A1G6YMB6_9BURK|nr:hypothetical protein [Paraburkholderia lycopersici]SDD90686.1 hypothetical protein SAMN05421548_12810 [Paraburkholderia lycopersici]
MFNEPGHDDCGPWQCPYCGTGLNAPLILCPECGANQLAAASRTEAASESSPDERVRGVAERLRENLGGERTYRGDYPSIDEAQISQKPHRPFPVWAGFGALAIALAGYAVWHHSGWEPKLGAQVVVGSVLGSKGNHVALATRSHSAQAMAALPRHGPAAKAGTAHANAIRPGVALQKAVSSERAPASPAYANALPDVARSLAIARTSLDRNNLWPARRAIMNALAAQPGNADAQQMRAELVAREQQRDVLIGRARLCAHERQWACVRQDAGHAASVDASSREAKHLLVLASGEHKAGAGKHNGWTWPWESQTYAQAGDARSRQDALFWHH